MKTIYLHGYLNDLHPEPIKVFADSVFEALSALALIPAFNPKKGKKHEVVVDGFATDASFREKTEVEEIHVRPVVSGAGGRGGFMQLVIGALLIAVSFIPVVGQILGATLLNGVIAAGIGMVLGGVLQMLMPQPQLDGMGKVGEEPRSQYLGARGNTVAIGTCIPIILGRCRAWGHYLSFDVDAGTLNGAPASWYSSPFTNYGETTYSAAPEEVPTLDPQEEAGIPLGTFQSYSSGVLHFTPAIDLPQGQLDVTFNNGRTLHIQNSVSGVVTSVQVLGGNTDNLPASGTPIVFTQNYV